MIETINHQIILKYKSVKFFEGPFNPPEEHQYKNHFPKSTTRYIFFSVFVDNQLYRNRVHKPLVIGRYYRPDGSQMRDEQVKVDILPDWENADLWNGWGWETPGNWPVGTYRVEIWFGNKKVGEERFSIYDDKK